MYVPEWRTVSALTRGLFWRLFNKRQNNLLVSAEKAPNKSTYIILFLTQYNASITDEENDDLYTSSPCLTRSVFVLVMTSQSIADEVTMTRQYCDTITWIVKSN